MNIYRKNGAIGKAIQYTDEASIKEMQDMLQVKVWKPVLTSKHEKEGDYIAINKSIDDQFFIVEQNDWVVHFNGSLEIDVMSNYAITQYYSFKDQY